MIPENHNETLDEKRLSPEFELAIMHFWAAATQMERNFSRKEIEAVPALMRAIRAAQQLPGAIGWHDVNPQQTAEPFRVIRFGS